MPSHISKQQFSEQTLRQVAADCRRALQRAHYNADQSLLERLRCVDEQAETEETFGRQLWYFEGRALTLESQRIRVYGVIEYSVQYGLQELVDDSVMDSPEQRDRFRDDYHRIPRRFSWQHPSIKLIAAGMFGVTIAYVSYVAFTILN